MTGILHQRRWESTSSRSVDKLARMGTDLNSVLATRELPGPPSGDVRAMSRRPRVGAGSSANTAKGTQVIRLAKDATDHNIHVAIVKRAPVQATPGPSSRGMLFVGSAYVGTGNGMPGLPLAVSV